jgi:hypothetical protein
MAIDTRNKRSSAINITSPWRSKLPLADGTVAQADRQHAGLHYEGILAVNPLSSEQNRVVYRRMKNVDDTLNTYNRHATGDQPEYARVITADVIYERRHKSNNAR